MSGTNSLREIVNHSNQCRICLGITNEVDYLFDGTLKYLYKLNICFPSLNISEVDPYPNHICYECSRLLDQSYEFYLVCLRSDEKLRAQENEWIKIEAKDEPEEMVVKVEVTDTPTKRKYSRRDRECLPISIRNRTKRKYEECHNENGKFIPIKKKRIRSRKYECDICGVKLFGKSGIVIHLRRHSGERPFTCDMCGKSFVTNRNLQNHILSKHTDNPIKRFKCQQCSFQTNHAQHYHRHIIIHTGELPFSCDICSRRFNSLSNRNTHIKNIHTEPAFPCEFCNEKFRKHGSLKRHIVCHYSAVQYQCPVCGKSYSNHRGLLYHMRKYHADVKRPTELQSRIVNYAASKITTSGCVK